jgi:hypothetical protein
MQKKTKKGFSYRVTVKQLKQYMRVPAKFKLQWLEEAKEFFDKIASPSAKKCWQMFREGKL